MEGGRKSVFASFFFFFFFFLADQKIASSWRKKNAFWGTSNKLLLVAGHILTTGLQKCL